MTLPAPAVPVPPPAPVVPARALVTQLKPVVREEPRHKDDPRIPLPENTQLGDYTILTRLGQGGFGITYRARHNVRGNVVVIKEHMPEGLAVRESGSDFITYPTPESEALFHATLLEFTEEVTVLMGLQHPGIVPILDAFETNGTAYYVMPFVAGTPLELPKRASLNRERQAQEARRLKRLLTSLLDTLLYLEQHNVVHRDIKPENIRITPEGDPILLDFGSARQLQEGHVYSNIFTPGFCAPEQVSAQTDAELTPLLGPWTDIYALGATFYYLITRMLPPRAEMRVHARPDPYKALAGRSSLEAVYGKPFLAAIDRAMECRADDRWQDAAAWRDSIEEGDLPVSPRQLRRFRVLGAVGGVTLTVFAAVSLWALHERNQAQHLYGQSLRFTESILYDFNEELADIPGSTELQKQLGLRLQHYLDGMEQVGTGQDGKLARAVAAAWMNLASVHLQQGKLEDATNALRKATAEEQQLFDADPDDRRNRYELARTLLMRAEVARRRNLISDARVLTGQSLTLMRELCHEVPHNPDYLCVLGRAMASSVNLARIDGNRELRKAGLDEMMPLYRALVCRYPEHEDALVGLGYALQQRAQYAMDEGDYAYAAHLLDEEQRIFSVLSGEQPYRLSFKQGLASALYYMGSLYNLMSENTNSASEQADYDERALDAFNRHLEYARQLEELDPFNTEYTYQQCLAMAYRVDPLLRAGKPQEVITTCETLLKKAKELQAASPDNIEYALLEASAHRGLALAYSAEDVSPKLAEAEFAQYREMIESHLEKAPDNTMLRFMHLEALSESAAFAIETGDVAKGLRWLGQAEKMLSDLLRKHPGNANLAKMMKRFKRMSEKG